MEGISGAGMFPNLAGQHAEYLENALKAYRNGDRESSMMSPMASGLTDEDIADISAYYSSLKGK
jgi:cytochrome c553